MVIQRKNEKKENDSGQNMLWSLLESFLKNFIFQMEKKIQQGAEDFSFFLKKKLVIAFFFLIGSIFIFMGIGLSIEKFLVSFGFLGGGWIITGVLAFVLGSLVNKVKK